MAGYVPMYYVHPEWNGVSRSAAIYELAGADWGIPVTAWGVGFRLEAQWASAVYQNGLLLQDMGGGTFTALRAKAANIADDGFGIVGLQYGKFRIKVENATANNVVVAAVCYFTDEPEVGAAYQPLYVENPAWTGVSKAVGTYTVSASDWLVPSGAVAVHVRVSSRFNSNAGNSYRVRVIDTSGNPYVITRSVAANAQVDSSGIVPLDEDGQFRIVVEGTTVNFVSVIALGYFV